MKIKLVKFHSIYHKYNLAILMLSILLAFSFGYFLLSPFLESDLYYWVKNMRQESIVISELTNYGDMVTDGIVSSMVPVLIAWAIVMFAYSSNNTNINQLNAFSKYFNFLTRGPGTIILLLGFVVIGMSCYGIVRHGQDTTFFIIFVIGFLLAAIGFIYRKSAELQLKKNKNLDKYSFCIGSISLFLALLAYLYGIIAGPIRIWLTLSKIYNGS